MQSEGRDIDTRLLSCWAQVGAELHTTGRRNCPSGGAVAGDHCSVPTASPTLVIKEIIRIQTDKKMASASTLYMISLLKVGGGGWSWKWNIKDGSETYFTGTELNFQDSLRPQLQWVPSVW